MFSFGLTMTGALRGEREIMQSRLSTHIIDPAKQTQSTASALLVSLASSKGGIAEIAPKPNGVNHSIGSNDEKWSQARKQERQPKQNQLQQDQWRWGHVLIDQTHPAFTPAILLKA